MLKQAFPGFGNSCDDLASLFGQALMQDDSDKVSLVVTAPPSFSINARTTMNVVRSMIEEANSSILITGYSLSSYFADFSGYYNTKESKRCICEVLCERHR